MREDSTIVPMQDAARTASRFAAPIAQIWCEVLKLEDVGVDEDFFTLGGDSLRAVEMLAMEGRDGTRKVMRGAAGWIAC